MIRTRGEDEKRSKSERSQLLNDLNVTLREFNGKGGRKLFTRTPPPSLRSVRNFDNCVIIEKKNSVKSINQISGDKSYCITNVLIINDNKLILPNISDKSTRKIIRIQLACFSDMQIGLLKTVQMTISPQSGVVNEPSQRKNEDVSLGSSEQNGTRLVKVVSSLFLSLSSLSWSTRGCKPSLSLTLTC